MFGALGIRPVGIAALGACLAVAAGCSFARNDGESASAVPLPEGMPACSEEFQQGKTIEEANFGRACRSQEDELIVPRYVRLECADDTTLVWNDFAWGYVGQPMQLFDPNAASRIPADEALTCRVNAGNSIQNLVERRLEAMEEAQDRLDRASRIANERLLVGASRLPD